MCKGANIKRAHARPIMHCIHLVLSYIIGASVSEAPSCDIYTAGTRYCACAALRANVAGQIGNRFSPAESEFSACIGSGSSQTS